MLKTSTTIAPVVENRKIQNHSWIGTVDNGGTTDTDALRRFDFAIQRDDFLAVAGVNNGSSSAVPALLANAYNAISVGLTDGNHSTGATTADGAGRGKPEIVAPSFATSFSTPLVSSAGAMLRQRIDDSDQRGVRQPGQNTRVVGAHDACADNADSQRTLGAELPGGPLETHIH